jgi:predicted dinucleotide-binding enzyme
LASWQGKTIIDATIAFVPPEDLSGLPSSAVIAKAFCGASFVKGFNHLPAGTLAADPKVQGACAEVVALPVSGRGKFLTGVNYRVDGGMTSR